MTTGNRSGLDRAGALAVFCVALGIPPAVLAGGHWEDGVYMPEGQCVSGCDPEPVYSAPEPSGPSPEELRQQREEQDNREAADDAMDRGERAWRAGDLEAAERWYRQAYNYAPDDGVILQNLQTVQQRLGEQRAASARASQALREAQSIQSTSVPAASTGDAAQAREGFDTPGQAVATPPPPPATAASPVARDPQVPASLRTPKITALEKQRSQARAKVVELEKRIAAAGTSDPVAVAKMKQEVSDQQNKVNYVNFTINDMLEKHARDTRPHADQPATGAKP